MLSPCGAALSFDARRAARLRGTLAEPLIAPWGQRLIQLQVCLIYLDTVMVKCGGTAWLNGTALHPVLFNSEVRRLDLEFLAGYPLLINLLTYAALAIETMIPIFLWSRPRRPLAVWGGIALHGGIMLLLNVPLFGEMLIASYLLFMDPDEVDRILRRINPAAWLSGVRIPGGQWNSRIRSASDLTAWRQLELGFRSPDEV
jgi:hypothetical protein